MDSKRLRDPRQGRRRGGIGTLWAAAICVALLIVCCSQTFAQAGIDMGSVTGTVKDPTGALVKGAHCRLTDMGTGVSQQAITTSAGAYTFPLVKLGIYSLKVDAQGFEEFEITGIQVDLGSTATEDVSLTIGAASTSVTVTSAAPLLQAQDASLGTTISSEEASDLPIYAGASGRSFMELATIAAGVQFTGGASTTGTFLVHGVESGQIDARVNGADDNNEVFGGIAISPIPETIQEFKLQTGNNSADLGHSYGAVANVVTKRGTNAYKGEVWDYSGNDLFNANDYFNKLHQLVTGSPKLPNRPGRYKENIAGGLFGGPVVIPHFYNGHNKTFFMADYEHENYTDSSTFTGTVPSEGMQNSNFSDLSDLLRLTTEGSGTSPQSAEKVDALGRFFQQGIIFDPATTRAIACNSIDTKTGLKATCPSGSYTQTINGVKSGIVRDPFLTGAGGCPSLAGTMTFNSQYNVGNGTQTTYPANCFNQLQASRLDPNALALLKLFPGGNQPSHDFVNDYFAILPRPVDRYQFDVRIDHTISDKDSLFGTYSQVRQTQSPTPPFSGIIEGGSNVAFWSNALNYMAVVTETHVFNPNWINEFRASHSQEWNTNLDPGSINSTRGIPGEYGIQGIPQSTDNGGLPTFAVSGISSFGSRTNTTWSKRGSWQYSDSATKLAGKHEWKFGGEINFTYGDIVQLPYSRGDFTYNGQFSDTPNSGDADTALADFLLLPNSNVGNPNYSPGAAMLSTNTNTIGGASAFSGNGWTKSTYHAPYLAFYAVDTWKVTPSFTVNMGLREEYYPPYSAKDGNEANFWMGGIDGNQPEGSTYYIAHDGCSTAMSPFFKGLLAYDNIPIVCEPNNTANKTNLANWAPRVGIAYRIRPNLVARVGGGIAYGALGSVGYGGTLGQNYPFFFNVKSGSAANAYTPQFLTDNVTTATMESTFGDINLEDTQNAAFPVGSTTMYGKQYNYKVPSATTLTAAVQWQFTNNDSVEVRYVGNIGRHLDTLGPYHNAARELLTPSTGQVSTCTAAQLAANPYCENSPAMANGDGTVVPFPNLATSLYQPTNQISDYESGEAEYIHHYAGGFSMDSNYTFVRCWSDAQAGEQNTGLPTNGRAPMVLGFGGYRADYTGCGNTATNVFRLSGTWNIPVGQGARWASHVNGWQDAVIGGWKLNPIWIAASGTLNNVLCQGTNGYGANPNFTGKWFQTTGTNWNCEATLVPGQHLYGPGPKDKPRTKINGYWNSSAFSAPQEAVQENGQLDFTPLGGRENQIYGPGWYNVNLALHKMFNTSESTKLEFQAQALNLMNHMQPDQPGTSNYTTPGSESLTGGFGAVTTTRQNNGQGRIMQFVGRFYF